MSNVNEPVGGRFPASGQDLFQVVSQGGSVIWHLNQENNPWFNGTGNPGSFTGQVSGDLYLDTASGNIWQFNGTVWNQVGNAAGFSDVSIAGFRDDFMNVSALTISSTSTQAILEADTSWQVLLIKGGESASAGGNFASSTTNPGILSLEVVTPTSGDGVVLSKNGSFGTIGATTNWQIDFILSLPTPTNVCVTAGVAASFTTDPPTNAMYVRYDTAAGDTQFTWVTNSDFGGTTTSVLNSVTPIAGNFYHFRIRSLVVDTVLFSVNGGPETAISTSIPFDAASAFPFLQVIARSTTNEAVSLDFFSMTAQTGRT
jgi:hypothetical protein